MQLDGILVTERVNYRYLTGFTGSRGYLLVLKGEACLFTDFRYTQQAGEQVPGLEIREIGNRWVEEIHEYLGEKKVEELGLEKDYLSYQLFDLLRDKWADIKLRPEEKLTAALRSLKDPEEVSVIQESVDLADRAFTYILGELKPGVRERDIALKLEFFLREAGASERSFDFIVASGKRGAMPHGVASEKALEEGDLVTLDFGGVFQGYCSDITRTLSLGKAGDREREIYRLVKEGQERGLAAVRPGVTGEEADKVVRDFFVEAGYGKCFGHGLGHGVGLEVHEAPRLAPTAVDRLEAGMIVTVEPGIYIPDFGGVRIEDMVLVTGDGCRVLTGSSKEFMEL